MMQLKDKISIVTGAAQGIGRGIADRFVTEGAFVAVIDYKEPRTKLLDGQQLYQGDVSDPEVWLRITSWLLEEHGRIDILVNNAAIIQHAPVHEVQLEDWNGAIAVNLTSVMLGMRAVIPGMLTHGGGSIINLSSIWGSVAAPGAASYHATKAGVHHLTKNAAVTYAKNDIRVNSIHPGVIHTPMMEEMPKEAVA
jgi:NAD(P)-dependent dehydrogenase (short-subunit alcohol dehydrogenase family)